MYFRHNLSYPYPEKCDGHMITVKHCHDVNLDENYPYLQKGFGFQCRRAVLQVLMHTVMPPLLWLRYGLRIHGRKKLKQYQKEFQGRLLTISNHVFMWDFICIMRAMRPTLGFFPVWKINLEGSNAGWIRMAGGIPVPTENLRPMAKFMQALDEVFARGDWVHFFPEGSMWFYYPDIRPLKKAVFKYAVTYDRPIIPLVYTFRPRKGLWKLLGKTPLVDLNVGEPIFRDQDLPKPEAIKKLQAEAYHIMQVMAGVHPGDPTYCADLNPENYQKTM